MTIISCYHGRPGNPQPCPPRCPVQEWPRIMFRPALLRRNGWVLRRKYRGASGPATPGYVQGDGSGQPLSPIQDGESQPLQYGGPRHEEDQP